MESDGCARVKERPHASWTRVNTILADQHDGQFDAIADFHLFEFCRGGRQQVTYVAETEHGDRGCQELLPGMLQYHTANSPTSLSMTGTYTVQQIYIEDTVFRQVIDAMSPGDPDNFSLLSFHGVFDPDLARLAERLLRESRQPVAGHDLLAEQIAQQIALLIVRRRLGDQVKVLRNFRLSDQQLARVVAYIEEHLEDAGGLDALAEIVDMDVFSFTRAFKKRTGKSPHSFIIGRRLTRAVDMLVHSSDSIADIAYACGFSSQSHMTTTFSKQLGITPAKYRKEQRG